MVECVTNGAEAGVNAIIIAEAGAVVTAGEIVMAGKVVVLGEDTDGVILVGIVAEEVAVVVFRAVVTGEEIIGFVVEELVVVASVVEEFGSAAASMLERYIGGMAIVVECVVVGVEGHKCNHGGRSWYCSPTW